METPLAPPVLDSVPPSEQRLPGGWMAFLAIFFLYVGMTCVSIFSAPKETETSFIAETMQIERAVKSGLSQRAFNLSLKDSDISGELKPTEEKLLSRVDQSEEAAILVLTSQTLRGAELSEVALDKLLLSENPEFVTLGEAYEGTLKTPEEIKRKDFVGTIARWKAVHPQDAKIPFDLTGVKVNELLSKVFMGYMIFVMGGGIVLGLIFFSLKLAKQLPAKGYQDNLTLGQADRHATRLFFYMFLFILIMLAVGAAAHFANIDPAWGTVGGMLAISLFIPSIVTLAVNGPKFSFKAILGDTSQPVGKILWGVGGFMANFPIAIALMLLMSPLAKYLPPPNHEAIEQLSQADNPGVLIALFLATAIFAPLVEEPTFRGLLAPALGKVLRSPFFGILVSSVMFAIVHPQGPLVWPSLAMIGATCAILTRQTGSLIPAMVMHFCHNATIVFLNIALR